MSTVVAKKLTPVLIVDAIEPCLPLWIDRLGWTKTAEVPHGDALGFVILAKDGVEVMYQTWASVGSRHGHARRARRPGTSAGLFIEVSDIDEIEKQLGDLPRVVPAPPHLLRHGRGRRGRGRRTHGESLRSRCKADA